MDEEFSVEDFTPKADEFSLDDFKEVKPEETPWWKKALAQEATGVGSAMLAPGLSQVPTEQILKAPVTIPSAESISDPAFNLQRIRGTTLPGKLLAAPVNVAEGLVEGMTSPLGIAASVVGGPAVKGLFAGLAAKEAGRQLGTASVTKDPQDIAEGVLGAALAPAIALPGSLPKAAEKSEPELATAPRELATPETEPATPKPEFTVEDFTTKPSEPATPPVTEPIPEQATPESTKTELVGMGGALAEGEIPESGIGGEKYGVAARVREERAKSGQVDPVEPGKGISTPDSIERGRMINNTDPAAPETLLAQFEKDKRFSADLVAAVRAKGEELAQNARRIEEQFGTDSPEYDAARNELSAWDKRTKPVQTEWHKSGMAQQGWTDLDTGSYTGLEREFRRLNDKGFNEKQKPKAERIATAVRDSEKSTNEAAVEVNNELQKHARRVDAERAALDAVHAWHQRFAVAVADTERKLRVLDAARKTELDKLQKAPEEKALSAAERVTKKQAVDAANAEVNERLKKLDQEKERYQADLAREQKALDAATKAHREAAVRMADIERKRQADPSIAVWEKAREYLDKDITRFDDLVNKVAADLGIKVEKVIRLLGQTDRVKKLTNDLWNKQLQERQLKEKAKRWVSDVNQPAYEKFIRSVPRTLFAVRVGFHGTVALGTHAPAVAFQPEFWGTYVRDFGKMYKMVADPAYYEQQVQSLIRSKNYNVMNRAGLQVDPFKYEDFNNPALSQYFGRLTGMGNRGYFVLKILRKDMFDQWWDGLPKHLQIPEVAQSYADIINHVTGVVKAGAPSGANIVLFAPRLEMSRAAYLFGDPVRMVRAFANWKGSSIGEQQFAMRELKSKAWVAGTMFGLLALNQGILSQTNSKQKINLFDPFKSDWMKFKVAGINVTYGNPLITMTRIPIRVSVAAAGTGGKLKNLIYPDEDIYKMVGEYGRSQLSPFASLIADQLTREDYARRQLGPGASLFGGSNRPMPKRLRMEGVQPYTWKEYWTAQGLPIPFQEGIREVWKTGLGMSDEQIAKYGKAFISTLFMSGTGGRVSEDYNQSNQQHQYGQSVP